MKLTQILNALIAKVNLNTWHRADVNNPHSVTKEQLGLGQVDNTADMDKPVSYAMQQELNTKAVPADITWWIGNHEAKVDPHAQYAKEADLGTIAGQNAGAVNIDGGSINGTTVGLEAPAAGAFTSLSASGRIEANASDYQIGIHNEGSEDWFLRNTGNGNMSVHRNATGDILTITPVGISVSGALSASGDINIARQEVNAAVGIESVGGSGRRYYLISKTDGNLALFDGTAGIERLIVTSAGNLGLGITPSAWTGSLKAIEGFGGSFVASQSGLSASFIGTGAYFADFAWRYKTTGIKASYVQQFDGAFTWSSAPSGTAGDPIAFTQHMTLDASGNLLVGVTGGNCNVIAKGNEQGDFVLNVSGTMHGSTEFYSGAAPIYNASATCQKVSASNITGRSINAGGTINASGADYAEYERNNGLTFAKGDVVGFAADGTLTNVFADAIRFAVKSTNPSYVGGDTWGSEDKVGKRPEQPIFTAPAYEGVPKPEEPVAPVSPECTVNLTPSQDQAEIAASVAVLEAYQQLVVSHEAALTDYETAYAAWQTDDDKYQAQVMVAESFHAAAVAQYEVDIQIFEAKLEAARQSVDRVAYSGKVPCNVLGAHPGDYIVAVEAEDGGIEGEALCRARMSFDQYLNAVGRVNRILDDGRCEVAVMVH